MQNTKDENAGRNFHIEDDVLAMNMASNVVRNLQTMSAYARIISEKRQEFVQSIEIASRLKVTPGREAVGEDGIHIRLCLRGKLKRRQRVSANFLARAKKSSFSTDRKRPADQSSRPLPTSSRKAESCAS